MTCTYASPVGSRVACHHPQIAKGKKYRFVAASRCETCQYRTHPGTPTEAPPVVECMHRGEAEAILANCGCQGIKTLDLYQCELLHQPCAKTVLDHERIKETLRRSLDEKYVISCPGCPHRAAVGQRPQNLHVITCLFNPTNSDRLRANYRRFLAGIKVPLHTVELLLPGQKPIADHGIYLYGDPRKHLLWQKERLLNIALSRLPGEADAVAWIDADILFPDDTWVDKTLDMLKDYHVGQLWAQAEWLGPDGEPVEQDKFVIGTVYKAASRIQKHGHPGMAWAARREFLDAIGGFFDAEAAVGGGDSWMAAAFRDDAEIPAWRNPTPGLMAAYQPWADKVRAITQGRVGYVPVTIRHLYHGRKADRRYQERFEQRHGFDPATDLTIDHNGLWAWTGNNPALEQHARDHFKRRQTDTLPHVIAIRAAYTDAELSQRRLDLTRQWCIPSLKAQTAPYTLLIKVDDSDPHLTDRKAMFESVGVPVEFVTQWGGNPAAYITRMDDDDAISPDFMIRLQRGVVQNPDHEWYQFTEGYLVKDGKAWNRTYPANQFVTRRCTAGQSPYDRDHSTVTGHHVIDRKPAWVWIRHADNKSPEKDEHLGCYGEPQRVDDYADIFGREVAGDSP